jgi:hypothetical protein
MLHILSQLYECRTVSVGVHRGRHARLNVAAGIGVVESFQLGIRTRGVMICIGSSRSGVSVQWCASCHELARALTHWHFDGDGCLDRDRPLLRLGGGAVITPGETAAARDNYRTGCARLGVAARDDGWALWHTRDDQGRPCTTKAGLGGR